MKNGTRYVTCPECERSFNTAHCLDGKLPTHTFCGKPCPGSELPKEK